MDYQIHHTRPAPDQVQEIHLSDYLNVVLNRRRVLVLFFCMTVLTVMVMNCAVTPVYQATSKLVIGLDRNMSSIYGQSSAIESYYAEEKDFNTHFKLITSKPVVGLVLNELEQQTFQSNMYTDAMHPVARAVVRTKRGIRLVKKAAAGFFSLGGETQPAREPGDAFFRSKAIEALTAQISVTPVDETRIMEIRVCDIRPQRARFIADTIAQKYIEFDRSTRLKHAKEKLDWMTGELFQVKKRLEQSEKAFIDYKQSQRVFSMEGRQTTINQKIEAFNQNYLDARNKKLELDIMLRDLKRALGSTNDVMEIKSMVDEPIIRDLYAMLTTLEIENGHLSKVYKAKHPKRIQIESQITDTRVKLKTELEKKLKSLKRERNIQASKEKEMSRQIAAFEKEAMHTNEKELTYTILQRNVNTNQEIYDVLLAQVRESNILMSGYTSNLTIAEQAQTPAEPVRPNKKRNFLLSIILGLFGGAGLCFLLEYLDQTIRNEEDIETSLGYPVLAIVPDARLVNPSQGVY